MGEFLRLLFDTSHFPPRWECGYWTDFHGWLHIISDLLVWGAYTAIPLVLIYFLIQRRDVPFNYLFLLFGLFILSCGTVHLVEAIIYWEPIYRVSGLLKLVTAIVSWATVFVLIKVTPEALKLPGLAALSTELAVEVEQRKESQRSLEASRAALRAANDELKRRNRDLDEFAHVASHDLREPLRQIIGFSELVELNLGENVSNDMKENLQFIAEGAQRMRTLIADLLEFSSSGRGAINVGRVDLNETLHDVRMNLRNAIDDSGAELEIGPLPEIWGEPVMLGQLFQNLISNAIKYCHPQRPPRIKISHEAAENRFTVQDNGIGIDPENLNRIFVPFVRLHSRSKIEGTGLGLSICRRVVELHRGQIWAESESGEGTKIHFSLNLRESDQTATDSDESAPASES